MGPWRWWATCESGKAGGEWGDGDFATRAEAVSSGLIAYRDEGAFWIIEARQSEDMRFEQSDYVPFKRTRNLERIKVEVKAYRP